MNPLRQKLINMLYLVLIGMIVLNLPVEFIEAFTDLNRTLERANYRLDSRNRKSLTQVNQISKLDSARFGGMYYKILTVKAISDSAVSFLDSIKTDLITRGGGYGKFRHLARAIDATLPTRRMIYDGIGEQTRDILVTTKIELLKFLDEKEQMLLDTVLITSDSIPKTTGRFYNWDRYYFDNVPLAAAIALLTKFQNDVRLAESIVINKYHNLAESGIRYSLTTTIASDLNIDTVIIEKVDKKLDVFNLGEDATVRITLPGMTPEHQGKAVIYTFDENQNIVDSFLLNGGVGEVSLSTGRIGEFKIKGVVKYRSPDQGPGMFDEQPEQVMESLEQEHTFELDYSVINPKPHISYRDYDILYLGVNNPVNIYHPEFSEENYKVSISSGKINYDGKQFYAKVYRTGLVNITLEVPDQFGGFRKVAEQQFKVVELPQPKAKLYNQYGGNMSASIIKKQKGLTTDLQGQRIDAKFRIMEFTLTYVSNSGLGVFRENVKGSYFTDKSLELIKLAQPGDIFIFENIRVKGPDGKNKDADALVFNII